MRGLLDGTTIRAFLQELRKHRREGRETNIQGALDILEHWRRANILNAETLDYLIIGFERDNAYPPNARNLGGMIAYCEELLSEGRSERPMGRVDEFTIQAAIDCLESMPDPGAGGEATNLMVAAIEKLRGWFDSGTKLGIIRLIHDHPGSNRQEIVGRLHSFLIT